MLVYLDLLNSYETKHESFLNWYHHKWKTIIEEWMILYVYHADDCLFS